MPVLRKNLWKESLLVLIAVLISFFGGLGLIYLFAPQLIGKPVKIEMVRSSQEIPPFFDSVFRKKDYQSKGYFINDPYIKRAKPLYPDIGLLGPNDILGFRNRSIPNVCDIIAIGDSQTYGRNALIEKNWPNQLASKIKEKRPLIYSMAVGSWGAIEYLEILPKALVFRPRIIIVAFYTGNDAYETFQVAYSNDRYAYLRPDTRLTIEDAPKIVFPPFKADSWKVQFRDGIITTFNAKLRYGSNKDHPAIRAGYKIMGKAAYEIGKMALNLKVKLVFTIIPTKEFIYSKKIEKDSIKPPDDYLDLIEAENKNISQLAKDLRSVDGAICIDLSKPLQKAATGSKKLYKENWDGHPIAAGYEVIADSLAPIINELLPEKPKGLVKVKIRNNFSRLFLIKDGEILSFSSDRITKENGWAIENAVLVDRRDIANLPYGETINSYNPEKYGPKSVQFKR